MIRRVLTFPDPVLKLRCEPAPLDRALALAEDLVDTMRAHPGCVGIAAPQVGAPLRVAVVDVRGHRAAATSHGLLLLVDPEITGRQGSEVGREGCLSLPDVTADVARAKRITLVARPGAGEIWTAGFEARAVQHELDHLDGILILDRLTSVHALHPRRAAPGR